LVSFSFVGLVLIIAALYGISRSKRNFRQMLAVELPGWVEDGIISPEQATQLERKYQLDRLVEESRETLLKTLFMFGAALIALGVVAFVAAHWELIPKHGKWILITLAMLGSHTAGYRLWKVKNSSPYLGHALIILGTLIFGADIALIGQIFHLPGEYYYGLLFWSLGTLAVGYAVQSTPHFLMALIASLCWFIIFARVPSHGAIYLAVLPAVVLPYAYRCHSRGTHAGLAAAWMIGLFAFLVRLGEDFSPFWLVSALSAVALGFWGYGDLMRVKGKEDFGDDSKVWSAILLSFLGYGLTYYEVIKGMVEKNVRWPAWNGTAVWAALWLGAAVMLAVGYRRSGTKTRTTDYLMVCFYVVVCTVVGLLPDGRWAAFAGVAVMNAFVVLFGAYLFWKGLSALDRRYFWMGLALLILIVVSRFFEYDTGLLWKSVAFILAGVGLIYGGMLFEKKRKKVLKDAA